MRLRSRSLVLLLIVLGIVSGLSWVVNPVHATGIIFKAIASNGNVAQTNPFTIGALTVALGDALVVNIQWFGTGAVVTVTDTQGNVYTNTVQSLTASSSGPNTAIFTAIATATGSDTVTVSFNIYKIGLGQFVDYSGVGSFAQSAVQQLDSAGSSGTKTDTLAVVGTGS